VKYYGNHRSLLHGNLTGMVHFQTSTSWQSIKAFRSRYFVWLTDNRVFINYTKFKTDTLVPCGFLVGAHPGHFRRNEAEEEFSASLGLDPGEIPFQLSSCSVSVPIKEDDPRRYSFNAVVIETSTKHATRLRERFYELADPSKAISDYPYTGLYQFVPMVKSTDWSIQKIYQLAQLHSSIIDDLKTIYVHHIQDVNNIIDDSGYSLLQGFYGMTVTGQPSNDPKDRLIQSIHNTSKPGVKVVLVQSSKHEAALGQFANLYNILQNSVNAKFHSSVLFMDPDLSFRDDRLIRSPLAIMHLLQTLFWLIIIHRQGRIKPRIMSRRSSNGTAQQSYHTPKQHHLLQLRQLRFRWQLSRPLQQFLQSLKMIWKNYLLPLVRNSAPQWALL
jgi:hypothetical protein